MIRSNDGTQTKRLAGVGDKIPVLGISPTVITYTATGGETSINLSAQTPPISYKPGQHQLKVRRSSGGGELFAGIDYNETSTTAIGFAAGDALIAGEIVEIELKFAATGVMAATPRPDCYTATATTGQTTVAADFSWPYNSFPSKGIGATRVYLNGVLQTRGVDYLETNLGTSMTNSIQFVDALLGEENTAILPTQQVIDDAGASTQFNNSRLTGMQSMISAGTQAFVDQSTDMIAVPNTTIVGRARIPNLANDLRASLGVERIPVQSIMQLQNEFGASGEPVFAAVNDDRGLIRFVGGWYNTVNVYGVGVTAPSSAPSSYVEVTFYGTGINLLFDGYSSSGYYPTIDGGTEQSVLAGPTSAVISGRNYSPNVVLTSSSCHGLSLGIHTVKFRNAVNVSLMGFEILNANASGYININTGTAYANGSKIVKSAASAIAYNTGVTGTKGGRVVRYLNSDGTVGQAFQAVNAAAAYLTSADHANEEVVRPYNCKEFGAGRADDFSLSFNSTARAFTLDDGTTTLVGNAVMGNDFITPVATNDFFVFTFVGTGLDITGRAAVTTPTLSTYVYSIDGGSEVSFPVASITAKKSFKVVSGLPYGTHTFKLKISALNSERMFWYDFIVYGPKKPTIPATAVELCDYNVMADFIQNTTAGLETIATGVLRKTCTRELVYTGTWLAIGSPAPVSYVGGFETAGNTINNTMSLRFFGTGIDLRFATAGNRATNVSVQFDDLAATTENFPSLVSNVYGGCAFSAGVLNQYDGAGFTGAGCRISGLPLGVHTVKFINNVALYFVINVIDIITPIHAVKSNLYADLQNTLPVGSCSLTDSRKTSMIKEILPAQKAWAQAVGLANATTSSTSFVPLADLSLTIKTSGGAIEVKTSVDLYLDASSWRGAIAIYVDGIKASGVVTGQSGTSAGAMHTMPFISAIVPVSAGVHKVDVYWRVEGGTTIYTYVDSTTNSRMLSVQEL